MSCQLDSNRTLTNVFDPACECCYPAQVLVVDDLNGPADLLMDTIGRLLPGAVSLVLATGRAEAERALHRGCFDLIVAGIDASPAGADRRQDRLDLLAELRGRTDNPALIAVTGDAHSPAVPQAQRLGAREVLALPARARELKQVFRHLARTYLLASDEHAAA